MRDREGEEPRDWTPLCSQLFADRVSDRCVGFRSGSRGLPRIIGLSKAAASPHKGGTRWNNAIFVEEEADGDEAAHSDVEKEIKKEGTSTTEGREKKREAKKRMKGGRETEEGDEERREV